MATTTTVVLVVLGLAATVGLLVTLVVATREVRATVDRLTAVRDRVGPAAQGISDETARVQRRLGDLQGGGDGR